MNEYKTFEIRGPLVSSLKMKKIVYLGTFSPFFLFSQKKSLLVNISETKQERYYRPFFHFVIIILQKFHLLNQEMSSQPCKRKISNIIFLQQSDQHDVSIFSSLKALSRTSFQLKIQLNHFFNKFINVDKFILRKKIKKKYVSEKCSMLFSYIR